MTVFDQARINDLPVQEAGAGAPGALDGIRVVDFTHFVAGPLATMTLADFGADVIKVEAPIKGDDFRYYPPADPELPAQGAPYLWTNRNKRSIGLDMKTRAGLEVAKALIASADVLVEEKTMEIKGRDLVAGLPRTITVTSEEIREALAEPVAAIVNAVKSTLEKTPPELAADLVDSGIVMAGGGSQPMAVAL